MSQSIATKDDFYVLGHPVKLRIYGEADRAFAEISGFNLSAPLTADQLNDLGDWLKSIADKVDAFERAANE